MTGGPSKTREATAAACESVGWGYRRIGGGKDGTPEDVVGHYVAQLLRGLVNERRIFVAAD